VAKGPQGGAVGGGGVTNLAPEDERLLVGVLRQSFVSHLLQAGGGVTPESAYKVEISQRKKVSSIVLLSCKSQDTDF
jgi:hypothetical protein